MWEYLLKSGFLVMDDFHGTDDWENFMAGMRQIFPDANKYPVEDLTDKDEIFHVLYDMENRFQVPGEQFIRSGCTYEKDGYMAKWRGIRDDHGRLVVAICHNMRIGRTKSVTPTGQKRSGRAEGDWRPGEGDAEARSITLCRQSGNGGGASCQGVERRGQA